MTTSIVIPADFPVQPIDANTDHYGATTCGTCGLTWDDSIVTSMTPAPSARCPFESFHAAPAEEIMSEHWLLTNLPEGWTYDCRMYPEFAFTIHAPGNDEPFVIPLRLLANPE